LGLRHGNGTIPDVNSTATIDYLASQNHYHTKHQSHFKITFSYTFSTHTQTQYTIL
jgi:hypothetical protein